MLNEHDSHYLYNECVQATATKLALDIVNATGATFGVDGDKYYYGFGELPEQTSVYGFGETPHAALMAFNAAYYSQKVKAPSPLPPRATND